MIGTGGVLLLSLAAFDWFAFSDREQIAAGSEGNAFRWLDGLDYVLFMTGLVALAAPLVRLTGLVDASPRDVAVITGSAGLIAAMVVAGLIASPPGLDRGMLNVPVGGGPTSETVTRGVAVVGMLAGLGIVALSVLTIVASPAALAPAHPRRPAAPAYARRTGGQQADTPTPAPAPKPPAARPSLATATVDDLVGVGFTDRQAERIVEYRDDLGKVTKLSDLKRVPGIAKPVLAELVKRLDE